jgi:hypothetical protein
MWSPEIVSVEVRAEAQGALDGGGVGASVGPLPQQGLDESFGFAVGSGSIGAGSKMAKVELLAEAFEPVGDVAGAVVGHDGLD